MKGFSRVATYRGNGCKTQVVSLSSHANSAPAVQGVRGNLGNVTF